MEFTHFSKLVASKAKKYGKRAVMAYRDNSLEKWIDITWEEFADRVQRVACAIASLGIKEHDTVGICSQNMPHSIVADFANYSNRCVSVPMYATSSQEQIAYMVNDAAVSLMFVGEQMQYDNVIAVRRSVECLKTIVVFDASVDLRGEKNVYTFDQFMALGNNDDMRKEVKRRIDAAREDDLAIIMYTSGTTGKSKGVMLLHSSLIEAMRIHDIRLTKINRNDTSMAFLPMSHVFERAWGYFCLHKDVKVYVNQNPSQIQKTIKEVRPTMMCAVPRFWEKIAAGVQEKIDTFSPFKKAMVTWALAVGQEYNINYVRIDKRAPMGLYFRYKFANRFIFSLLKKVVGIDRGRLFPTAGAALDDKLAAFFRSMGIPVCYGYGLTETTATVCCYDYKNYVIGSMGSIMPGVEVKIGDDNEILVKGKTVCAGYYNNQEATDAAFVDGWFRTGDAGKMVDNHLYMTDRIKDLFKTSNGKYIAPQQIETAVGADRYIEQIAVIGNDRNFVTAIIAPNLPAMEALARERGIEYERVDDLFTNETIVKFYEERIAEAQKGMAGFERIKRFRFIKHGFSLDSGELTSTLKLRRAVIQQNYATLIEEMYESVDIPR